MSVNPDSAWSPASWRKTQSETQSQSSSEPLPDFLLRKNPSLGVASSSATQASGIALEKDLPASPKTSSSYVQAPSLNHNFDRFEQAANQFIATNPRLDVALGRTTSSPAPTINRKPGVSFFGLSPVTTIIGLVFLSVIFFVAGFFVAIKVLGDPSPQKVVSKQESVLLKPSHLSTQKAQDLKESVELEKTETSWPQGELVVMKPKKTHPPKAESKEVPSQSIDWKEEGVKKTHSKNDTQKIVENIIDDAGGSESLENQDTKLNSVHINMQKNAQKIIDGADEDELLESPKVAKKESVVKKFKEVNVAKEQELEKTSVAMEQKNVRKPLKMVPIAKKIEKKAMTPSSLKGKFAVQYGVFQKLANAKTALQELKAKKLKGIVYQSQNKAGLPIFYVYVGNASGAQKQAALLATKLRATNHLQTYVVKIPAGGKQVS